MKFSPIVIAAMLPFVSCIQNDFGQKQTLELSLSGKELQFDGQIVATSLIYYDGSHILASAAGTEHPIHYFSIENNVLSFKGEFLNRGRGPKELSAPVYYADSTGLYVVDNSSSLGNLHEYSFSDSDSLVWKRSHDLSSLRPYFLSNEFVRCGNGRFIVAGGHMNEHEIISIIDAKAKKSFPLEFWPEDGYEGMAAFKQVAYAGNASLESYGDKLMYACPFGRYLDIMTMDGNIITHHNIIYDDIPKLIPSDSSPIRVKPESEFHGIQAKATAEYIYVRHWSKYSETTDNGYPSSFNNELEVFDWDGNLICRYRTDKPFYSFFVAPDNSSLLTVSLRSPENSEEIYVKYPLEPLKADRKGKEKFSKSTNNTPK